MSIHRIEGTALTTVATKERLTMWHQYQKQEKNPIFYILPSNQWLRIARLRQPGMAFKTFDDIATRVLDKKNVSYIPITEQERTLFFQQFTSDIFDKSSTEEENHKARAYADTYGQLKRLGLTIEELPKSMEKVKPLFKEYEQQTVYSRKMLDPENRIQKAGALDWTKEELGLSAVIIDGFYDFSPLQYVVIEALVKRNVPITIYLPSFAPVEIVNETKENLSQLGFVSEISTPEMEQTVEKVSVVKSTTIEEEIHAVFEEILQEQLPLTNYGILLVDDSYTNELERISLDKNVPLNKAKTMAVEDTAICQLLLNTIKDSSRTFSKWDKLSTIDLLAQVLFLSPNEYKSLKFNWIQSTSIENEAVNTIYKSLEELRMNLGKKEMFSSYINELIGFLEQLQLLEYWQNLVATEINTECLKKIRNEWKGYENLLQLLKKQHSLVEEKGLQDLLMQRHIFIDWIEESLAGRTIYLERRQPESIGIFTFRDVALFEGKKLFVIGMNEGKFPISYHLGGYFQERDLYEISDTLGLPTQSTFRMKQDVYFKQLFYLVDELVFTYVVGIDQENPLLPSPYIERYMNEASVTTASTETRMSKTQSFSTKDKVEKTAYFLGRDFQVRQLDDKLGMIKGELERLEKGEELLSSKWEEKLRKTRLAITMLESYARCPFRFAMERVMEIKEPTEEATRVSPLDTGSMIHSLIERFYKKMGLIQRPFGTFTKEEEEQAEGVLLELFNEEWEKIEQSNHELTRLQLLIEKEQWHRKLKKWWAAEKKQFWHNKSLGEMLLLRLEEPITLTLSIDDETNITLTGKVDRVDKDEAGFVIYDYKSGDDMLNFDKHVRPGMKLQLPLYLLAIQEKLTEEDSVVTAHGASYISLKAPAKRAGNGVWRQEHVGKGSSFKVTHHCKNVEETLEGHTLLDKYELKQRVRHLWEKSSTDFSVKPLDCHSSCPYKLVCRVTDEQKEEGEGEWT
ncbi:PD-(D/E)XK nuclease family protein [Bacillus sp. FJAT-45350]|uniref:PD-(D/E)XK nuclease family protein n=1 Tax=Bacillus sp. FJAT-45350 TaxID=2011014 RepID=UPI000BB7D274|nr:PD-(D/E)XK nuclease family protein [Bacillus sp. FJAT-45350]